MTLNQIHETFTASDGTPILVQVDSEAQIYIERAVLTTDDATRLAIVIQRVVAQANKLLNGDK